VTGEPPGTSGTGSGVVPSGLAGELRPLDRGDLAVAAPDAAVVLLGKLLVRDEPDGAQTVVRIVETEAYRQDDPASHSVRRTVRTEPMFWQPGTAYVYRSYGSHWCLNVTAEQTGVGAAVLLRAARIVTGRTAIRTRRPRGIADRDLLRGPGRLTAGLDLDAVRHDRGDLITGVAGLALADDGWRPDARLVVAGPRVGIRLAADRPWRFHLDGVAEVSPYRRSGRAPARPPHRAAAPEGRRGPR
jgi:DNA-3-methyladenine glycosylase